MAIWLLIGYLGCGMVASTGLGDESLRAEYEQKKQEAKLDPASQLSLALWCERHGMAAERNRHLSLAALRDPDNPRIRSLMGQLKDGDDWKRAEELTIDARVADPIRDEYRARRARMKDTDAEHEKLADWCSKNGLDDEADAHLRAALRIDPKRTSAWKKLGYRRTGGRWVNDEILEAEKIEAETQKQADEDWKGRLTILLKDLRVPSKKADAEAALDEIHDPRAVPAIWKSVVVGKHGDAELGIRLLSRLNTPASSRLLALAGVRHNSAKARAQAAGALQGRDSREFAGPLVELIGEPIKYEVRPVNGPGSTGVLFIEGEQANLRRTYTPPSAFGPESNLIVTTGPDGLPATFTQAEMNQLAQSSMNQGGGRGQRNGGQQGGQGLDVSAYRQAEQRTQFLLQEGMKAAQVAQAQLAEDVAEIERKNEGIREVNARVYRILGAFADLGRDAGRDAWRSWYQDSIGYRYDAPVPQASDKPIIDEPVPIAYQPTTPPPIAIRVPSPGGQGAGRIHPACFALGTPVHTRDGLVPIEKIRIGDQVLSLDARTGQLAYKPVISVLHNPPAETLKIRSGGETVVATTIHRFWKAGQGWSLARDLTEGDPLRGIRGVHLIESIVPGETIPVYNLEVAESATFFVGQAGWLVRDHTIPDLRERPYDAEPEALPSPIARR